MKAQLGIVLVPLLLFPPAVRSQEPVRASPGARVRVTAPRCGLRNAKGILTSLDGMRFTGTFDGREADCPSQALTALEVSVGTRHWWKASLIGGAVGAGIGLIWGGIIVLDASEYDDMAVLALIFLPPIGAGIGLLGGTMVGIARGTDTWSRVPLPPVGPYHPGVGAGRIDLGISIPLGPRVRRIPASGGRQEVGGKPRF